MGRELLAIVAEMRFSRISISGFSSALSDWNSALLRTLTSSDPSRSLRCVRATWMSVSTRSSISSRMKSCVKPEARRFRGLKISLL